MELAHGLAFARTRQWGSVIAITPSGRPHLTNIGYVLGSDDVARISITDTRAKTRYLRADPRASLYAVGDDFWHWVVLEGEATVGPVAQAPDDEAVEQLIDLYRAIAGDHQNWDEFRQSMVDDQRLVLSLRFTRAYGQL